MRTGLHDENDSEYLTTSYYYDAWNRLVRTEDSTGYNSGTVTYDLNGNVLTMTDANDNVTTNTYDVLNRLISSESVHPTDVSKNVSMTYTYDNMGRLTKTTSNNLTTTYTYDALGRKVTESEYRDGYSTFKGFFYAGVSQYMERQVVGIRNMLLYTLTDYVYDDEMRIIEVTEDGATTVSYTYDSNGNKASETLANGVTSTYTYNNANRITHIQNTSGEMPISEYEYSYYLDGSDACKTRIENGIMEVTSYEYDGLKRLTSESVTTGSTTDTYTYKYDDYSNRAEMTVTGSENYTTVYSYNDSQGKYKALLMSESKTSADEKPLPGFTTTAEKTTYTYDKNGSQLTKTTSEKTETNTYNAANQLVGFTDGETTASYSYNASGLRYEKTVDGETVHHVWDGSQQIIADVVESQFYEANCYIRGTNLAATYHYQNGAKSDYTYYVQNAHGDVVNLTDAEGAVTKTYHYDAFGVELDPTTGDVNVFRYCGEYFDTETGTVYLRARYYQAAIGRFTQRDSVTGELTDSLSLNLYTYCANNPIIYFDPSGHKFSFEKFANGWNESWQWVGESFYDLNSQVNESLTSSWKIGADEIDRNLLCQNNIYVYNKKISSVSLFIISPISSCFQHLHYNRNEIFHNNPPSTMPNKYDKNWKELELKESVCHQFTAVGGQNHKFVSSDGGSQEGVYNNSGELVTDPIDVGTYNIVPHSQSRLGHLAFDVAPWIIWGNSSDDRSSIYGRIKYSIKGLS